MRSSAEVRGAPSPRGLNFLLVRPKRPKSAPSWEALLPAPPLRGPSHLEEVLRPSAFPWGYSLLERSRCLLVKDGKGGLMPHVP